MATKRLTSFKVNPQVSELIEKFDGAVDSSITGRRISLDTDLLFNSTSTMDDIGVPKRKRPPPPLIPISAVRQYSDVNGSNGEPETKCIRLTEFNGLNGEAEFKSIQITEDS